MIWEEIEPSGGIFLQLDAPILNPIMQPVDRQAQPLGHLGDCECARNVAGMRLVPGDKAAMLEPQAFDRTDQHLLVQRGAKACGGQFRSNLLIGFARGVERQYAPF